MGACATCEMHANSVKDHIPNCSAPKQSIMQQVQTQPKHMPTPLKPHVLEYELAGLNKPKFTWNVFWY
jgi:hypothetical protein